MSMIRADFVLAVHDVKKSAQYYVDALGFQIRLDIGGWIFVERDKFVLRLGECPDDLSPAETGSHNYFAYFHVDHLDSMYREFQGKGVQMLNAPTDQPWGMREFGIVTIDGHRIMFSQKTPI